VATLIEIQDMRDYATVVQRVIEGGDVRAPRGLETLDLGPTLITIEDPTHCLATGGGRGLNPRIAATEAIQLIGGFHDPKMMLWSSPEFARFMDNDRFHGAYGRRVNVQVTDATDRLLKDPDTRRAVVTIWDPNLDNAPDKHDYPCTIGFTFALRDGRLTMATVMRSNDVWLGFPYDVFQFTQLQLSVARSLGVDPGPYSHYALSLHIYDTDLEKTDKLTLDSARVIDTYQPQGIGVHDQPFAYIRRAAQFIPYASATDLRSGAIGDSLTESERWYHAQFDGYRISRDGAPAPHLG
jgi:thymidylate synthase